MKKVNFVYFMLPVLLLSGWGYSYPSEIGEMTNSSNLAIQAKNEHQQIIPIKNKSSTFAEKYLFGSWKVKKIVKYAWITTISKETATKLVGTTLHFDAKIIKSDSKAMKPILTTEDQKTTPRFVNPQYVQTPMSAKEFNTDNEMVQLKELGFIHDSIDIIEIFTDKHYENQWSFGYIYIDPLTPKRLIVASNGYYFELQKIK